MPSSLFLSQGGNTLVKDPDFQEQRGDVDILQEALDLGIVSMYGDLLEDFQTLHEAEGKARRVPNYGTEVKKVILTKDSKFARLVRRASVILAKQNNDPKYAEWKKHMTAAIEARKAMELKYNSSAQKRAKEIIANSKKLITKATVDLPKSNARPST